MTRRSPLVLIVALFAVHNAMRLLTWWRLGERGLFNYLAPIPTWRNVPAPPESWWLLALALAAYAGVALAWTCLQLPQARSNSSLTGRIFFFSVFCTLPITILSVLISVLTLGSYGSALFLLLPFAIGFINTAFVASERPVTWRQACWSGAVAISVAGLALLLTAIEGAICLLMALPIAIPMSMMGGLVAFALRSKRLAHTSVPILLIFSADAEHAVRPAATLFEVSTFVEIDAPQQRVWQTVLQPAVIDKPSNLLFRAGVAYPLASHIAGVGPSATRYCDFSTGKLVEPVLIWQEPHQLRFRVASNPLPMQEWTPYAQIHPPHLDGFLVSRQGEFRLTSLGPNRTRLEAITRYEHNLWPEAYWRLWSDKIIHDVHSLVLSNIQNRALEPRLLSRDF